MKKVITTVTILLLATCVNEIFAQGQTRFWYFGKRAGLDFSTNPPTLLGNGAQNNGDVDEGHSTISDANGNLLFYTNGMNIWNRNHVTMPNGTGLQGHWSSTQCATVFPVPGSTTQYYLITSPVTGSTNQYRWNIIDLTLNSGLGDIRTPVASNKNQVLPSCPTYVMEALTSVPHSNGTDIWVIGHTADDPSTTGTNEGGSFLVWRVSSSGITFNGTYTLGYAYPQNAGVSRGIGIMKSNSCFTRLAISYYNESSRFEMFSFNNSTGVVGNMPAPINAPLVLTQFRNASGTMVAIGSFAYGIEFSPNGRYLYGTISGETGSKNIIQYDLQAGTGSNADIQNSCFRLTPASPAGVRYGMLQLGPDGRIYHTLHQWNAIGAGGYCQVGAILSPNSGGAASNYNESYLIWPGTFTGVGSTMGLPSFHKGFLAGSANIKSPTVANLEEVCVGEPVSFDADYIGTATNFKWDINKNISPGYEYNGPGFSSTPDITYSTAGIYDVELVVTDNCGYDVTAISKIKVNPVINPTGSVTCNPPTVTLTATSALSNASHKYVWFRNASGTGNAIGEGSPIVVNFGTNNTGSFWLQEVGSATTSSTSGSVSNITTPEAAAQNSSTARITTLNVTQTLTLNSFQFRAEGCWGCTGDLMANYIVTIKNPSGTVIWTGNVTNYNIN
ncbi:MAG: PKD domain-containing protein, partial [Cytophagales bacterium]